MYIELKQYDNAMIEVSKAEQLFADGIVKDYGKKAKILARKASILAHLDKLDAAIHAYEQSLIEDQNYKVKDELLKIKKIKKEREEKSYINPQLAEEHCDKGNALFKEGNLLSNHRKISSSPCRVSGSHQEKPWRRKVLQQWGNCIH